MKLFQDFLDTLLFHFLTDDSYEDILTSAGIDLVRDIPENFYSKTCLDIYNKELATTKSKILAREKCRSFIDFVTHRGGYNDKAYFNAPFISDCFRDLNKKYHVTKLAERILLKPDELDDALGELEKEETKSISIKTLADFVTEADIFNTQVESGTQLRTINKFPLLSKMIGGFNPGRIGLLTGTTGFGKTNFGLTLGLSARDSMKVLYCNMEMSFLDIFKRLLVLMTGENYHEALRKKMTTAAANEFLKNSENFKISDGKTMSIKQIKCLLNLEKKRKPFDLVVVDYDQKLELKYNRDTPEWKALQQALETFDNYAKEFGCYILVLAQLNREGEISGSFRSTFPAHTVLSFESSEEHGPVITAKKNRHGKKYQSLLVEYNEENSSIIEKEIISTRPKESRQQIKLGEGRRPYVE